MVTRSHVMSSLVLVVVCAAAVRAQPPATWSGWARCDVAVQGPGYSDRQTHTWTMAGGTPTVEGAFRIYPASWSVVGAGSLQRTQGTQSLTAQWAANVAGVSAPLALFVRASDGRMFISARHAQLRAAGAVAGYQQLVVDGVPQTPGQIAAEAFEWAFPTIDVDPKLLTASGSKTSAVNGSVGVMQPAGSQVTASCTWQFGQGASGPPPPPPLPAQTVPVPPPPTMTTTTLPPSVITLPPTTTAPPPLTSTTLGPGALTLPQACTLRGPAISYYRPPYISPLRVNVGFESVSGATGYNVSRNDLGRLTPSPLTSTGAVTYFVQKPAFTAPLDYSTAYVYTFTALYPNGCGTTTLHVTPPWPNAPRDVEVIFGPGAGRVAFRARVDDPQRDFTGILVKGPGLPPDGRVVMSAGENEAWPVALTIDGVPAGTHTWTFTTFYDIPGGRILDMQRSTKTVSEIVR
jgi:hypothetical protein